MSSTLDLVTTLKAELRRAGITYAHLATELGMAESSIKRIFAKGDMPLSRIDEVLAVLKMDFAELARLVANASPAQQEMTLEQERAVVRDPKLLLTAICALSQWTLEQIVEVYAISKPQAVACLLALDKLGFLELRANNRYRLKIDKTFIQGIAGNRPLAEMIVSMCRLMRLSVVAEGVETAEQLDWVRTRGIDLWQGYLFARPMPAAGFTELLLQQRLFKRA
jgi:transcriptional regulator with XRE-family HTH domain